MVTVWISYAWADNQDGDVDFIAQELRSVGLATKLDRWAIGAGRRLWEQIETFIKDPAESDAWVLVATANSLQSEPCREEFAYALQRALSSRGGQFPVIGVFPGPVDSELIPGGISTRLFVSMTDPDWKERVRAAAEGRAPKIAPRAVDPFVVKIHQSKKHKSYAIEVRPRGGVWQPFFAAVPMSEKSEVDPNIMVGPPNQPTDGGMLTMCGEATSDDKQWWIAFAGTQANPTTSYYIWCRELPTRIVFGVHNGQPQYDVRIAQTLASGPTKICS